MVTVCRLCARWAERVVGIDDVLVDNLLSAKAAIKQMFRVDLSCPEPYPNRVCLECVHYLKYSYVFQQQLLNAEMVFQTLQERGELRQRLLEMKNAGDALQFAEMVVDEPEVCEPVQSAQSDATMEGEDGTPTKPSERVIEIKIEAIEELEIISTPLKVAESGNKQSSPPTTYLTNSDENLCPDIEIARIEASTKGENKLRREPMTLAVPPKQKPNHTVSINKCYVCYTSYGTKAELMLHLLEHNDLLPYRCERCSTADGTLEFRTIQALNKHLEMHRFRPNKVKDHLRTIQPKPKGGHTCARCGMKFQDLRKFCFHVNAHRNRESEQRQLAHKKHGIMESRKRHRTADRSRLHCKCCNWLCKTSASYKQHKSYHTQTVPWFQCIWQSCRKNTSTFSEWRRHLKTHMPSDGKLYIIPAMLPEPLWDPDAYPKTCPQSGCNYVAPARKHMYAHYAVHV